MSDSHISFFMCHAGQRINQYTPSDDPTDYEMGVIGTIYGWNGDWIRSPEEVGTKEITTEMYLISFATGRICSGTEGCFTQIEYSEELEDWYYDRMSEYVELIKGA